MKHHAPVSVAHLLARPTAGTQLELFPHAPRAKVFIENCKWCGLPHQARAEYVACMDEFLNR